MVALYHYCNLDGAGMYDAEEGAARSGAAAGSWCSRGCSSPSARLY